MIDVDGVSWRTLRHPIFCKGKRVREVYVDGTLVYPERVRISILHSSDYGAYNGFHGYRYSPPAVRLPFAGIADLSDCPGWGSADVSDFSDYTWPDIYFQDKYKKTYYNGTDNARYLYTDGDIVMMTRLSDGFFEYMDLSYPNRSFYRLDTSQVENFGHMFEKALLKRTGWLKYWDVRNGQKFYHMFDECTCDDFGFLKPWKFEKGDDFRYMFEDANDPDGGYLDIDIPYFRKPAVSGINMMGMFERCRLKSFDVIDGWDLSKISSIDGMFAYCEVQDMSSLDIFSHMIPGPGTDVGGLFYRFKLHSDVSLDPFASWDFNNLQADGFFYLLDNDTTYTIDATPLSGQHVTRSMLGVFNPNNTIMPEWTGGHWEGRGDWVAD